MTGFNSIYTNAIIINGPATTQMGILDMERLLASKIPNVYVIGDGTRSILDINGQGEYANNLIGLMQHENFRNPNDKTLVVVNAHGFNHEKEHILRFSNEEGQEVSYLTKTLLKELALFITHPIDVMMNSCYSGSAKESLSVLPKGSSILMSSQDISSTSMITTKRAFSTYDLKGAFSLANFYNYFLSKVDTLQKPIYVDGNQYTSNSHDYFNVKLAGKTFTSELTKFVKSKIDAFCNTNRDCSDNLVKSLNKIPNVTSLESVYNNYPSNYFKCLSGDRGNKLNADIAKLFKSQSDDMLPSYSLGSKYMHSIINPFVHLLNNYYASCQLPFEIIADTLCQKIFSAIDLEQETDDFEDDNEESDFSFVQLMLQNAKPFVETSIPDNLISSSFLYSDVVLLNNNFSLPEESEIGSFLLIARFVEEYCNQNPCPELA